MTKEQLAAQLNGSEYEAFDKIIKKLEPEAKASGLLIVFGESDDLVEFRGIFHDEVGAYEGRDNIGIDLKGVIPNCREAAEEWHDTCFNNDDDIFFKQIQEYVKRRENSIAVSALWDSDGYSWVIKTDVPHAVFDIMEGEDKFCKGLVIDFKETE